MKKILILPFLFLITLKIVAVTPANKIVAATPANKKVAATPANETPNEDIQELYWKAIGLYNDENYIKALLCFDHLRSLDPTNYDLNYYEGMCYYNLDKPKIARYYFSLIMDDNVYKYKVILLTHNELESMEWK